MLEETEPDQARKEGWFITDFGQWALVTAGKWNTRAVVSNKPWELHWVGNGYSSRRGLEFCC